MVETHLQMLVAEELAVSADPRATAMAAAIASHFGPASRAVLFYGSCLRSRALDGGMLDFYLIVSSYGAAYRKRWLAAANRMIPPNVFPFAHDGLVAKVAVLSESDFARLNGPEAPSVSVWARFAQPSRLVWAADDGARHMCVDAIARAPVTLFQLTLPVRSGTSDLLEIWREGFSLTYRAELRAEREDRSRSIVDGDPERYERFALAALERIALDTGVGPNGEVALAERPDRARRRWRRLQRRGKALTLLRLAKASGTYAGGIDYLAWKINRHAGTAIELRPWQRRWPLLGALSLLPRLLRRGAVR